MRESQSHASIYGDEVATFYDAWFSDWLDTAETAVRLAELAGEGPVLELGIGTGRVALPLVERGIEVRGIDASEAMVARLRARPGGDRIPVTVGDFSEVDVEGTFSLVYAAAGTFFELQSQEAQVRCFGNVGSHLRPGGLFVLDGVVPERALLAGNDAIRIIPGRPGQLVLRFRQVEPAEQRYVSHFVAIADQRIGLVSIPFRYATTSELDLMAKLAGLRLRERRGSWGGEPFGPASSYHVSVYERPGT